MKLTIELVPETCWYSNLRSELSQRDWDILRKESYRKANYCCEVCGGKGSKHPVECHEIWEFDDKDKTQTLKGLISLCPACHEVKHIGLAEIKGRGDIARAHLAKINGWNIDQAQRYINTSFDIWNERSNHLWTLDTSWVKENLNK